MDNKITSSASLQSTSQPSTQNLQSQQYVRYAGFWRRFAAYWLDVFLLWFVLIFVSQLAIFVVGSTLDEVEPHGSIIFMWHFFVLTMPLTIYWVYFVVMTYLFQATLGKLAFGIKVTRNGDNKRLSFVRVVLRETIGKLISAIMLFIGYFMVAFTEKNQAMHDYFADSVVIYKDPSKNKSGVSGVMVFIMSILGFGAIIHLGIGIFMTFIIFMANKYEYQRTQHTQTQVESFGESMNNRKGASNEDRF